MGHVLDALQAVGRRACLLEHRRNCRGRVGQSEEALVAERLCTRCVRTLLGEQHSSTHPGKQALTTRQHTPAAGRATHLARIPPPAAG